MSQTIAVVGLWHLGSVISGCWAELGNTVIGVDFSGDVVERLRNGRPPVFEPGLEDLHRVNAGLGRLTFTTDLAQAIPPADIVFVAFDTPIDSQDRLDLALLDGTIASLAPLLRPEAVVVISSQVPVGTCSRWRGELSQLTGRPVALAYSPENLRLGGAIDGYMRPERIVIGADDDATSERVAALFSTFNRPLLLMSLASAEMAKHALNSFLATSISFINEIADLCEVAGADTNAVEKALKSDGRIGPRAFLTPGLGFGGGTLGRDIQVLRRVGSMAGRPTAVLDAVLATNAQRASLVPRRLAEECGGLEGRTVAALGLTYKAGTSTLRRSTALDVVGRLRAAGARVRGYDPKADFSELPAPPDFEVVADPYEAVRDAVALVILTDWPEFARLDFERIRSMMLTPVIFDTRGLLRELRLGGRGFRYLEVGRSDQAVQVG